MRVELKCAHALLPGRYVVLGAPLLPLRIGHRLLLARLQSPLEGGGVAAGELAAAVAVAVVVCTRSARAAMELQELGALERVAAEWMLSVVAERGDVDWGAAHEQLCEYWLEPMKRLRPAMVDNAHAQRRSTNMPDALALAMMMCREFGETFETAIETPVSRAVWLCAARTEHEGLTCMINEGRMDEAIEKARAAEAAQTEASA